jgi:cell division protease FtsH
LNQDEIAVLFKNVKKIAKRKVWLSSRSRPASKQGPIAIPSKGSTAAKQREAKRVETTAKTAKPAAKRAAKPRAAAKKK